MINTADIYFPFGETERLFIKSIWRIYEYNIQKRTETILPKGTVEIIFNLSDDIVYCNSAIDRGDKLPLCFINGINLKPFNLIKKKQQAFLGIQLNIFALKILFNIPVIEFNNRVIDGTLICKSLNTLLNQIGSTSLFTEQVNLILKWFYNKIAVAKNGSEIHRICKFYYDREIKEMKVHKICHKYNYSERHFRRLSVEWLGMNTEEFVLYQKYLNSLFLLHRPNLTLTDIGYDAGYYDQSHFIREFKSFTGISPKEYRKTMSELPGHIYRQPL